MRILVYTPIEADTSFYAATLRDAFPGRLHVDAAWQPDTAAALMPDDVCWGY